jgi:predicted nucleic acid-binding protein
VLVVLDPGVFVSAAITPGGVASQVVLAGIEGRYEYVLCPHLVDELTEVPGRPKIARCRGFVSDFNQCHTRRTLPLVADAVVVVAVKPRDVDADDPDWAGDVARAVALLAQSI